MSLPNFLIVGAQKCGTTSLHEILARHPQIYMSEKKEVNYFTIDKNYQKGLSYYEQHFPVRKEQYLAIGESSPGYICYPGVAERIAEDLGDIKIVMIFRDPIKRAFSQYWDNRRHLNEHHSEKEIVNKYLEEQYVPSRRGYFSRGVYIEYLLHYRSIFSEKNVHVIILEDLLRNPQIKLKELYEFLNVDPDKGRQELPAPSNASEIWLNPAYSFFFHNPKFVKYLPKRGKGLLFYGKRKSFKYNLPDDRIIKELLNFYRPYNLNLSKAIGNKLEYWLH